MAALARFYSGKSRRDQYAQKLLKLIPPDVSDKVRFVGNLPHEKVAEYYQKANMLINPSLTEAFGMSLVEAMANGLPVIATRVGGMKEIDCEGKNGLLVNPDDPTALAVAIDQLFSDTAHCHQMGVKGRNMANRLYNWNLTSIMWIK